MAKLNIDMSGVKAQFEGLNGRHPGLWPLLPRIALFLAVTAVVMGLGWYFYWKGSIESLDRERAQEQQLRAQYVDKMKQAANLPELLKVKEQVAQYVNDLEKQLPNKAEMDALLSDINQAGIGRGLQFELFKPGQVMVKEYYAELPINVRLTGNYHDFAAFASDIANLPRIVTLQNVRISSQELQKTAAAGVKPAGTLVMEATAKTYRYLDADEVAEQRRKEAEARKGARGAKATKTAAGGKK